jgi:hypothetical protein
MLETPFFPAFRSRLAALGQRTTRALRQATLSQLQEHLVDLLPPPLLSATDEGCNSRDRIFNLRLTFECFVWQVLSPRISCRQVVRQVQALCRLHHRCVPDQQDSAYIQARQRLPRERLEQALRTTAKVADRRIGIGRQLQDRPVKVVDVSSTQLPDTPENQKAYPQSSVQKKGCGFPVMEFMALFSLCSGAVLDVVLGNLHTHDLRLLHAMWEKLKKGDIVLGDRAFGEFTTLAALPHWLGVDVVARLHQARKADFRKGKRLAQGDALFLWAKNWQQSRILSPRQWGLLPAAITVRVIRFTATIRGYRHRRITLVTSLLDPKLYPAQELIALYARRWRLELCLRDLKTQMGMEQLRCKTPQMAEKELLAYLVAHNLVRCLIAEAVATYNVDLERVSFKGSVDALRQYSHAISQARSHKMRNQLWEDLLWNLARDLVPYRPNRLEPRVVKRRPKNFGWLTKPRHKYRECLHRNRCWKAKPRDLRGLN